MAASDVATGVPKLLNFHYEAPVTEIALLRLIPPGRISDTSVQSALKDCLGVLRSWASRPFYLYICLDDPYLIYLIGSWTSIAQHRKIFLPSFENQALLQRVDGKFNVEWMFHIDLPIERLPLKAPVMSIGRYVLSPATLQDYAAASVRLHTGLEMRGMNDGFAQGRKVEPSDDRGHEIVILVGWYDQERSEQFRQILERKAYEDLRKISASVEERYVRLLEI